MSLDQADRLAAFKYNLLKNDGACLQPKVCTLYLTYRCNLKCDMCYQRSLNKKSPEMSPAEIEAYLQRVDPDHLYLVGGEIFVRRDIYEILSIVESMAIPTTLLTNGTLISPDGIEFLQQSKAIEKIIISLDGLPETHDRIRGKGAFDKAAAVIAALSPTIEIWTNTVILPTNVHELAQCTELYRQMGASRTTLQFEMIYSEEEYTRSLCTLQASGVPSAPSRDTVRSKFPFAYLPELKQVIAQIDSSPARDRVHYIPELFRDDLDLYADGSVREASRVCCADFLQSHMKVGPAGEFEVCEAMHASCGSVTETDPLALWNSVEAKQFRKHLVGSNMVDLCSRCCRVTAA